MSEVGWECPACSHYNVSDGENCQVQIQLCDACESECDVEVELSVTDVQLSGMPEDE